MFIRKLFLSAALTCLSVIQIDAIVSKTETLEKSDGKGEDSVAAESIDRDYVAGYEEHHGEYGLGSHGYEFPESYDSYGGYDGGKHHLGDHHHHHHHRHHIHHKHHDPGYHKALAIKGLLIPLAGVALLGAAAAFVSNPILLQLGVISGSSLGRRKRDTTSGTNLGNVAFSPEEEIRLNEIKLLEEFMSQVPEQEVEKQEKKILAEYFSCSGVTTTTRACLERLACEMHSPEGISMPTEATVLTIILNDILGNEFVPEDTKMAISKAVARGKRNAGCAAYKCEALEKPPTAQLLQLTGTR